jgi:hypothetical protein
MRFAPPSPALAFECSSRSAEVDPLSIKLNDGNAGYSRSGYDLKRERSGFDPTPDGLRAGVQCPGGAFNRQMRGVNNLREEDRHEFEDLFDAADAAMKIGKQPCTEGQITRTLLEGRRFHNP